MKKLLHRGRRLFSSFFLLPYYATVYSFLVSVLFYRKDHKEHKVRNFRFKI